MILTSGKFDGLHAGHVLYLEAAKALCERDELLICAIAPDEYIQRTHGRAPYWHQADRLRTVTALGCIDAAIPQQHQSVAELIYQYRPRLFIKGPDWEGRLPEDIQHACAQVGTAIGYVDTPGTHGSETKISDETALAQFEALVLSQTPANQPWQPVTDYSFEARKEIEGKHPQLIKEVFQPTYVCDAGCGPGHLLALLETIGVRGYGFDANDAHSRWDRPYIFAAKLDDPRLHSETPGEPTDLVICREVLEHLTIQQIRRAVTNLCKLSSRYVYVTTRFARAPQHLLSVDTADDLDPTHITMFSQAFLRTLFVLEGFKRRMDLESRLDWLVKGRVLVYERQ